MLVARFSLKRDSGVSPIVAVLLLLAITVVLTSVLYLVVINLTPHNPEAKVPIGVNVARMGNNWFIGISSAAPGLNTSYVYFEVFAPNGSVSLPKGSLGSVAGFQDSAPMGAINAGDSLLLPVSTYPAGSRFYFSDDHAILWSGELY